jgi:ketosteroid isomerase-like protein
METSEIRIVRAFTEAINAGDVEGLISLMAEDHKFIDSGGTVVTGLDGMAEGWRGFFQMFPDYKNEVDGYLQEGNLVMAHGTARGTYNGNRGLVPENRIEMPAAWKAIVENDRIKEWQVYADWTEGARIIEEDKKTGQAR